MLPGTICAPNAPRGHHRLDERRIIEDDVIVGLRFTSATAGRRWHGVKAGLSYTSPRDNSCPAGKRAAAPAAGRGDRSGGSAIRARPARQPVGETSRAMHCDCKASSRTRPLMASAATSCCTVACHNRSHRGRDQQVVKPVCGRRPPGQGLQTLAGLGRRAHRLVQFRSCLPLLRSRAGGILGSQRMPGDKCRRQILQTRHRGAG